MKQSNMSIDAIKRIVEKDLALLDEAGRTGLQTSVEVVRVLPLDHRSAWQQAAHLGVPGGQWLYGICCQGGIGVNQDSVQAFEWVRKAADQGHAGAQCNLGWHYGIGTGVEMDPAQAVAWYRKSAEQGDADAQFSRLGV